MHARTHAMSGGAVQLCLLRLRLRLRLLLLLQTTRWTGCSLRQMLLIPPLPAGLPANPSVHPSAPPSPTHSEPHPPSTTLMPKCSSEAGSLLVSDSAPVMCHCTSEFCSTSSTSEEGRPTWKMMGQPAATCAEQGIAFGEALWGGGRVGLGLEETLGGGGGGVQLRAGRAGAPPMPVSQRRSS